MQARRVRIARQNTIAVLDLDQIAIAIDVLRFDDDACRRGINRLTARRSKDQALVPRRLDLVEFHRLPDVKRLTIGDLAGRLYPGVRQVRTMIARDEYVLDVFQLESPTPTANARYRSAMDDARDH